MTDEWQRQDAPRSSTGGEWEVLCRVDGELRHVGSVSAPSESVAFEQARTLFGHASDTLWLCPASSVARFTTQSLGDAGGQADGQSTGERRQREGAE